MAFEGVDVGSLRSSLNSCKNSLNYSAGKEFMSSASNIWQGDAKENLMRSLDKLYNEKYKNLEQLLDKYLGVCDQIDRYKQLESEKNQLANEIERLKQSNIVLEPQRTYQERIDKGHFDTDGKTWIQEWEYRTCVRQNIVNQIDNNNRLINEKLHQMEQKQLDMNGIESQVNGMV